MTFQESLDLSWAKHGGHDLPWEMSKEAYTVVFQQGWHAHAEALKQTDLFPGSWDKDGLRPHSSTGLERRPCSAEVLGSIPSEGYPVTAEDIYALWPVKKARGAAITAIQKAMKKEKPAVLLAAVKELAECYAKWPVAERQYLPMCSTFMNQERWSDDRATWRKGADATTSQFSKTH
jgi:hypothetical protein